MDKAEPGKELSEDVTRESLIAISYGVPENSPTTEVLPKTDNEKVVEDVVNGDGLDIYRSKLISISYLPPPSPDVKAETPLPGQIDG